MSQVISNWFKQKIVNPVLSLLKQGVTPEKIAWSLSLGTVAACIPVLGASTLLCVLLAGALKLNHVAIQIANYAAYPLQFLLLIPFLRSGSWLFNTNPESLDISVMMELFKKDPWLFFQTFGTLGAHACVVWLLVGVPTAFVLYAVLKPLLYKALPKT